MSHLLGFALLSYRPSVARAGIQYAEMSFANTIGSRLLDPCLRRDDKNFDPFTQSLTA
jgi:hypothetical protein